MTENKNPVAQIRLSKVKAAIWKNQTENGTFYNVTFSRLYRAEEKKEQPTWKDSTSFGRDDLLLLAKVADQAHTYIVERLNEPVDTDSE